MAKRKNKTLIELTNFMLIESGALLHFYGEARVPHKKKKKKKNHIPHILRCGRDISEI